MSKAANRLKTWFPSLAAYGAASGILTVYLTDWRIFVDYLPYYNGKFKQD